MTSPFTDCVIDIIKQIPYGKVATYGQIAAFAGNERGARQVVRILHTLSDKEDLPWHRVINRMGEISLKQGNGYERQRTLLEDEQIVFGPDGRIDLDRYLWTPGIE